MKKINIKHEKPSLSDQEIASMKVPFAEFSKQFKAIPKGNSIIPHTKWGIVGGIVLVVISWGIIKKWNQSVLESPVKTQTNAFQMADSLEIDSAKNRPQPLINPVIQASQILNRPIDSLIINPFIGSTPSSLQPKIGAKQELPLQSLIDSAKTKNNDTINPAQKCHAKMSNCLDFILSGKFNQGSPEFHLGILYEDGLFGLNLNGRVVVKPKYDKVFDFGVYKPSWALVEKEGLFGFVDITGNEVVRPKYNSICAFGAYKPGWALVEKDGLYGFLLINGIELVAPTYDVIYKFGDYSPALALVEKDGLLGFLLLNGQELVKPKYNSIGKFGVYSPEYALVEKDGLFGLLDIVGVEKVSPKFNRIGKYGEYTPGLALVEKDGLLGFINRLGTEVTQPKYNHIFPFGENISGFALVEKEGLLGLINFGGTEMIKPKYDKIHKFGELRTHCAVVEKDGLFGFVAINGEEFVSPKYETMEEMVKNESRYFNNVKK